jgi:hypothetical protein
MACSSRRKTSPGQAMRREDVAGGGHGIDGVGLTGGRESSGPFGVLAVADDGLDGGAAFELASDGGGGAAFLALGVDLELVLFGALWPL